MKIDEKMNLLNESRRLIIYSFDSANAVSLPEREFSTNNSSKLSHIHFYSAKTKSHEKFFSFLFEKFNTGL